MTGSNERNSAGVPIVFKENCAAIEGTHNHSSSTQYTLRVETKRQAVRSRSECGAIRSRRKSRNCSSSHFILPQHFAILLRRSLSSERERERRQQRSSPRGHHSEVKSNSTRGSEYQRREATKQPAKNKRRVAMGRPLAPMADYLPVTDQQRRSRMHHTTPSIFPRIPKDPNARKTLQTNLGKIGLGVPTPEFPVVDHQCRHGERAHGGRTSTRGGTPFRVPGGTLSVQHS